MKYSNLTHKSNIFLKRFTHSSRHLRSSNIVNKIKFKTFLDFGTGDGQFFDFLIVKPDKKYFAYEPYKKMYLQFLKNKKKFNHVNIIKNKNNLKKIAKKNCTIIISVPIEVGFSSLIKNLIRIFYNSKHENMTLNNLLKSIFRKKIDRGNKKYFNSHIGFDYIELKKILENHFSIKDIIYSPFNILKSFLNSQIFLYANYKR
jgi:hypothetical protein